MSNIPRAKLCWVCSRRFRSKKGGGFHFEVIKDQGHEHEVHRQCVDQAEEFVRWEEPLFDHNPDGCH